MLTGTIINCLAILAGSLVGLCLRALSARFSSGPEGKGAQLQERLNTLIMQGVLLCVLYIGISGCLKGQDTLVAILSMVLGAIVGELLDLDARLQHLGDWVQAKSSKLMKNSGPVAEAFVTTSLVCCVGAMSIVGALENGLTGTYDTLKAKAVLDCITAIVFTSTMGVGVMFSAVAVFLYQGLISLLASAVSPLLGEAVIAEMTCVGSLLIVALAFNMLGMTKIKISNLIPAIFFPILLCRFF